MISTGSIYTLHEHLCVTILNRGRRLLPDDQLNSAKQTRGFTDERQTFKTLMVREENASYGLNLS